MQYRFFLCAKTYTWDMSKYTADRIVVDCGYIDTSQAPDTSSGVSMGLKLAFPTLTSVSLIIGFMRLINYCSLSSRFHLPSLPEIKQQQSPDYIGIRIFNSLSFFFTGICMDQIVNCHDYGLSVCSTYRQWADTNCPRYCAFCKGVYPIVKCTLV